MAQISAAAAQAHIFLANVSPGFNVTYPYIRSHDFAAQIYLEVSNSDFDKTAEAIRILGIEKTTLFSLGNGYTRFIFSDIEGLKEAHLLPERNAFKGALERDTIHHLTPEEGRSATRNAVMPDEVAGFVEKAMMAVDKEFGFSKPPTLPSPPSVLKGQPIISLKSKAISPPRTTPRGTGR